MSDHNAPTTKAPTNEGPTTEAGTTNASANEAPEHVDETPEHADETPERVDQTRQIAELEDAWRRTAAELDNFRKRCARDVARSPGARPGPRYRAPAPHRTWC